MLTNKLEMRVRELSRIISTELGEGRFGSTAWKKATMELKTLRRQFGADEVAAISKEAANEYTQRCVAAESQALEMRAAEAAAQSESDTTNVM